MTFLCFWQATLGLREDGIMTAELLHRLFGGSESGVTKNEEPESTDPEKVLLSLNLFVRHF